MRRPHDLSSLKCWWWVWRLCHYGVDVVFDGSELHVGYSGCRWVVAIFAKTMANIPSILRESPPAEASKRLAARHVCIHSTGVVDKIW
jgi:hypothetical protein